MSSTFPVRTRTYSTKFDSGDHEFSVFNLAISKFSNKIQVNLTNIAKPGTFYEIVKTNKNQVRPWIDCHGFVIITVLLSWTDCHGFVHGQICI